MHGWLFGAFVLLLAVLVFVQYSRVEAFRRGRDSGRSGPGGGGSRLSGGTRLSGGARLSGYSSGHHRPGSGGHPHHRDGHYRAYYPRRDVVYVGGGGWDWWPYPYDYWWSPLWFPSCALTGCPDDQVCMEDPATGYSYCV